MEDRRLKQEEQQPKVKEPLFAKSTLIILAVFLVLNAGAIWFFMGGGKVGGGKKAGTQNNQLDQMDMINLGRVEVTKPLDPMNQKTMRCSVTVSLMVPSTEMAEYEPKITKFNELFKQTVRRSFSTRTHRISSVKTSLAWSTP